MAHEATATQIINVPLSQAWNNLQDLSLAHNYVPGIVRTEIVSEQAKGLGASRYVYRNEKSYIQETVDEWNEGHGFRIYLHKGDKPAPPFKQAWFIYQLEEATADTTRFTATMRYELGGGFIGRWLGGALEGFVTKTIADVTIAMKLYYETGQPTTPAALKAYKATAS
ncbi:MAG: SRPBCC family protein [Halioglobus sp.]